MLRFSARWAGSRCGRLINQKAATMDGDRYSAGSKVHPIEVARRAIDKRNHPCGSCGHAKTRLRQPHAIANLIGVGVHRLSIVREDEVQMSAR
jgi:hypothetical protein